MRKYSSWPSHLETEIPLHPEELGEGVHHRQALGRLSPVPDAAMWKHLPLHHHQRKPTRKILLNSSQKTCASSKTLVGYNSSFLQFTTSPHCKWWQRIEERGEMLFVCINELFWFLMKGQRQKITTKLTTTLFASSRDALVRQCCDEKKWCRRLTQYRPNSTRAIRVGLGAQKQQEEEENEWWTDPTERDHGQMRTLEATAANERNDCHWKDRLSRHAVREFALALSISSLRAFGRPWGQKRILLLPTWSLIQGLLSLDVQPSFRNKQLVAYIPMPMRMKQNQTIRTLPFSVWLDSQLRGDLNIICVLEWVSTSCGERHQNSRCCDSRRRETTMMKVRKMWRVSTIDSLASSQWRHC